MTSRNTKPSSAPVRRTRGRGYWLLRGSALAATAGMVLLGIVAVAPPAAAAARAYGFEGGTGWLGTVTADDGSRSICVNPIGLFPSGPTSYVGMVNSIAAKTAANNGGYGGTAYTAGAAIQELNYAESVWVNTTSNVTAAGLDPFAYSLTADYPYPVGSQGNLDYYSERAGSSAAAVRSAEATIAARTLANYNTPEAASAAKPAIAIDNTTLVGTVVASVVPTSAPGVLTLTGATQTGTGATMIHVTNGQVVHITANATPDAATGFTVTATVVWTVPTTPLTELREYHTSTPAYAQLDMAPAGWNKGTVSNFATDVDPIPNTFSPIVSTQLSNQFFDVGSPINDTIVADVAAGSDPWMKNQTTGNYMPVVATGTWYSELPGTPTSPTPPANATVVGTETTTITGPGTYSVTGPVANAPGAYTIVWSISDATQPPLTQSDLPTGYSWVDQFGRSAETGFARSSISATTNTSTASQGLNEPASDSLSVALAGDTTIWPHDLDGRPVAAAFSGTEYWIAGDTAPAQQVVAPAGAIVVSSATLTATTVGVIIGPSNSPAETTDGFFVWQWSTPETDYLSGWTEAFGVPSQMTRVLAPTMATAAEATVAFTDTATDAVTISGPDMGLPANLTWAAYLEGTGSAATCDSGNLVFTSASAPILVTSAGRYAPTTPPTFTQTGSYLWVATLAAADGTVIAQGTCGDPAEQSNVVPFTLATTAQATAPTSTTVSDTATITGATPTGATLRFSAYKQATTAALCDLADEAYEGPAIPITGPGEYSSDAVLLASGEYSWVATAYDRNGHILQSDACADPTEQSRVIPFALTTAATTTVPVSLAVKDIATITGPTPPGATLQFVVYRQTSAKATCNSGDVEYRSPQLPITGAGNYQSAAKVFPSGTYFWVATAYDRIGGILQQGACGDPTEQSAVVPLNLTTTATAAVATGSTVSDTATITGPTPAGLTLQFNAYRQLTAIATCDSSNEVYTSAAIPVTAAGTYQSGSRVLPVGTYYWIATAYDSDDAIMARGTCGDPSEVSTVTSILAFTGTVIAALDPWLALGLLVLGGLLTVWRILATRARSRETLK